MDQQAMRTWRLFLEAHAQVIARLDVDLRREVGMPLAWYDVLVHLSEAPDGRRRMQDLARAVLISKSGLTRLVDRLCTAGYLEREPDPMDGRGTYAILTPVGRRALEDAAPAHLRSVEQVFTAPLAPEEAAVMAAALERVVEHARSFEPDAALETAWDGPALGAVPVE